MRAARTLADLVPDAARSTPDHVAVVDGDRSVTYEQLDESAGAIAAALHSAGVRSGDAVGVHLAKSIEAIAALHGILRLGAAYVPIDPTSPEARARRIATDAGMRFAVVDARRSRQWGGDTGVTPMVLPLDRATGGLLEAPAPSSDDLAYLLYTSGSTGAPKGVELTHGNAMAFVDWVVTTFAVASTDRLSSHAPLHFDLSILDVFAAAAAAATLVLVPKSVTRFPVEQARWIADAGITVWYSVPTALTLMVTKADLSAVDLSRLRAVLFVGEVFPVRHLAALMAALPGKDYWNLYGPTETNVCTAFQVTERPDPDGPSIPIGWPVCGDSAAVVGDDGQPVAPGAVGELVITGPTVAAGYRGAPDLTAARFTIPAGRQDRGYRTGDRVIDDGTGCLRFVGRVDAQVKVRGHRVELGEVEAALLRHADVDDGAVVAIPDDLVTNRLVAFVVPVAGATASPQQIHRHLADLLPATFLPDRIEVLDALPRTSTSKIDRVALAARAAEPS